jgi:hypothetical protein
MTIPNAPNDDSRTRWLIVTGLLALFWNLMHALYSIFRIQQSALFPDLFAITIAYSAMLWFQADRRARGISYGFDQEALVLAAWGLVLPFYIYRSRGLRKGTIFLLGVLGVYVISLLPGLTAVILAALLGYAFPAAGR